jgi:uncharacterized membrane protein
LAASQQWDDHRVEGIIGNLLRAGVFLSALVVFCGAIIYLARHGNESTNYRVFHGEPNELKSVAGIVHYAFALRGRGIIQLGLLLLIATPVSRVAFSIFGFWAEKDRMYVGFTVIVLVILLYGLFGPALLL